MAVAARCPDPGPTRSVGETVQPPDPHFEIKINQLEFSVSFAAIAGPDAMRNLDQSWRASAPKAVEQFPEINGLAP